MRSSPVFGFFLVLAACSGEPAATTSPTEPAASSGGTAPPPKGTSQANPPATSGGPPPSSTPAPGCGKSASPGFARANVMVDGKSRSYQLLVPAGYDGSKPLPLVFVFHGLGGDGDEIRSYFSFEKESAGKALFVYPDGVAQSSVGGATGWSESDLAFFDALLATIRGSHCVDDKRVFAAGHSFGAYMSNLVGCSRGDVVRAIAPVSGGMIAGTCKGPVAVWLAHGDKDMTVEQSEGVGARDRWRTLNGCGASTKPITPSPCVTYDGCSAGHPVTWCSFSGGHYPLPGFTKQAIWDFFASL